MSRDRARPVVLPMGAPGNWTAVSNDMAYVGGLIPIGGFAALTTWPVGAAVPLWAMSSNQSR
jgi:hypothetical protein